jgi:MFS family permease
MTRVRCDEARHAAVARIDTLPMMAAFVVFGPLGGWLSDRYGARVLATCGILVAALASYLLMTLSADFVLGQFAFYLFLMSAGMGLFSAPNTSQIMSSLPAEHRGSGSGMRATVLYAGMAASQAVFFTVMISSLSQSLGPQLRSGMLASGASDSAASVLGHRPPGGAIFAAILGLRSDHPSRTTGRTGGNAFNRGREIQRPSLLRIPPCTAFLARCSCGAPGLYGEVHFGWRRVLASRIHAGSWREAAPRRG